MMNNLRLGILAAIGVVFAGNAFAASSPAMIQEGHQVYEKWCAGCHNPDPARQEHGGFFTGRVFAGTYTLEQKYHGSVPAALEQRKDLSAGDIKSRVREGYNVMPRFRKTEVSDAQLDAIVAYLTRNNTH